MPNLKNITDLPVVESADGLNLIVEDNGSAKRIAVDAIGGGGGVLFVDVTGIDADTLTPSVTYEEAKVAVEAGRMVFLRYSGQNSYLVPFAHKTNGVLVWNKIDFGNDFDNTGVNGCSYLWREGNDTISVRYVDGTLNGKSAPV